MALKKLKGMETTKAHGQDTTKKERAIYNESVKLWLVNKGIKRYNI